jgi:hypothetical protein
MSWMMSRATAVFLVGLVGWFAAGVLRIEGLAVLSLPAALGLIGGLVGSRPMLLLALWLGMLAAYPVAFALGIIAFLGENWAFYLVLFLALAALGYGFALVLVRLAAGRRARLNGEASPRR